MERGSWRSNSCFLHRAWDDAKPNWAECSVRVLSVYVLVVFILLYDYQKLADFCNACRRNELNVKMSGNGSGPTKSIPKFSSTCLKLIRTILCANHDRSRRQRRRTDVRITI
jgi:hypothetical protein